MARVVKDDPRLPIKWNQWCSVVRWEFKDPTPFIRSREFLWQEGHTAHLTEQAARTELINIIQLYQQTYKLLCVPTISGTKTRFEKFAGADETYTVETYLPDANRVVQAATAHLLGTNFSKSTCFNIYVQQSKTLSESITETPNHMIACDDILSENSKRVYLTQNSWGFTTRSIGIMIIHHSDNHGLIIPPLVASQQFVIIPIIKGDNFSEVNEYAHYIKQLLAIKYRVFVDDNPNQRSGRKYNKYELEGIPFRIEIGSNEIIDKQITLKSRIGKKN